MPGVPEFREWKTKLRHTVASASHRPSKALSWLVDVEDKNMDELARSGRAFEKLDYALRDALLKVMKRPELIQEAQRHTA